MATAEVEEVMAGTAAAEGAATTAGAAVTIPAGAEGMTTAAEVMAAAVGAAAAMTTVDRDEGVAAGATMHQPEPMAEAGAARPPIMRVKPSPKVGPLP
jgi:hypothetical protein